MRKLISLYINEMIKISKKVSILVLLGIMLVIIFAFGALAKFQIAQNNNNDYIQKYKAEEMKRQLEQAKINVTEIQNRKAAATKEDLQRIDYEEKMAQNQVDMLQYAIDKNIEVYSSSYRAKAVQKIFSIKDNVNQLKLIPDNQLSSEQKNQLTNSEGEISSLQKIVENKDFKGYIAFSEREIKNNPNLSEEDKKIYLESIQLQLKHNITGEVDGKATDGKAFAYIDKLEKAKFSLLKDLDYSKIPQGLQPLTAESRKAFKDTITVTEYSFDKGIINNESNDGNDINMSSEVLPVLLKIGNFMTVILVMILAGGSVSTEMSTGSIKSLIISPTKRWKIFTAKFFSLLTAGIIATLLAYIFSVIANGTFFGFEAGAPYVYASNGAAHEINFYIYQLARLFTDFINVIIFMSFAYMLSVLTKNTAVSVALSISVYFIGNTVNAVLMQFFKGDWLKFIPFNNLDLTNKIFSYDTTSPFSNGTAEAINSLNFSLVYLAVLFICMIYIGLDSFNRRDIK